MLTQSRASNKIWSPKKLIPWAPTGACNYLQFNLLHVFLAVCNDGSRKNTSDKLLQINYIWKASLNKEKYDSE